MKSLIVNLVIFLISVSEAADVGTGKSGIIIATEVGVCKMDGYKESKTSMKLKDISKDKKGIDITLDFPMEIDDKIMLFFNMDKKVPGGWQKDFMKVTGPACNKTKELIPGLIKKLAERATPKYDITCPWKKGAPSVKDFPNFVDSSELNLPTYPYGQFKINFSFKDKTKVIFCLEAYVTIKKP